MRNQERERATAKAAIPDLEEGDLEKLRARWIEELKRPSPKADAEAQVLDQSFSDLRVATGEKGG